MNVENRVQPDSDQIQSLQQPGPAGPIVMVNLLKFKDKAAYKDGRADDADGRSAYDRYGAEMLPFVHKHGGRVLFVGEDKSLVIGEVGEMWDAVALVEYPSSEAFVKIAMSPDVAKFGVHREAGLAGQLLIQCVQGRAP